MSIFVELPPIWVVAAGLRRVGAASADIAGATPPGSDLRSNLVTAHEVGHSIGLIEDGDGIVLDAKQRRVDLEVDEAELARRKAAWAAPALRATRGTLYKYIKNVKSASEGCVTDE